MRDELSPISGAGRDGFGGWAASLVDALDTLWIMHLKKEFYEAAQAATNIDFSKSTDNIVNFRENGICKRSDLGHHWERRRWATA